MSKGEDCIFWDALYGSDKWPMIRICIEGFNIEIFSICCCHIVSIN